MSKRAVASRSALEEFREKVDTLARAAEDLKRLFDEVAGELSALGKARAEELQRAAASARALQEAARQKRSALANAQAACSQKMQSTPKTVEKTENGAVKKEENPAYAQLSAEKSAIEGKLNRASEIAYKLDSEIGELEREHTRVLSLMQSLNSYREQATQAFSALFDYNETALQTLQRALGALSEYMETKI